MKRSEVTGRVEAIGHEQSQVPRADMMRRKVWNLYRPVTQSLVVVVTPSDLMKSILA